MLSLVVASITVISNIFLGVMVYGRNPKSATHRVFLSLTLVLALWAGTNHMSFQGQTPAETLFWIRAVMVATAAMFPAIYLLAAAFPNENTGVKKWLLTVIIVETLFIQFVSLTPFLFTTVTIVGETITPTPGPAMPLYALHTLGFLISTLVILIKKAKTFIGLQRTQLRLLLWGIALTFILATITSFLLVIIFKITNMVIFGPAYSLILVSFTAYAIVKHRFLDISYLAARAVSYLFLLLLLIGGYALVLFGLGSALEGLIDKNILSIVLAVVVAFSFDPLRLFLESITDRILFKGRYDTEKLLAELTNIMASEIDITKLSNRLLDKLLSKMRLTKGAFLLVEKGQIIGVEANGYGSSQLSKSSLADLVATNISSKSYIFEEIESDKLKDEFRRLDISIALPLKVKSGPIGLLVLGSKASGDIYNSKDIELLEIFAPQVAVALQNSESYREIQEFSKVLEGRVDERTRDLKASQDRELARQKELLKLKDEFVFIATHDLRTPVTAIKGFVSLIEKDKNKLPKDVLEDFDAISQSSDRLNQLVNDLLQVARSDSGTITVEVKPVDVISLLNKTLKQSSLAAKEKKVIIKTKFDEHNKNVLADSEKLAEVMENLISNAIKYNKDKGTVSVETTKNRDSLVISVSDTGFGIPKAKQADIFTKFFRAHQPGTENVSGTGLGLFVVRMLVEKMHGTIQFESEENVGTSFRVSMPLANK